MSEDRVIPNWLAPYKNDWRSMSTMGAVFYTEGRPLSSFLQEIRPRLRCVLQPARTPTGVARYYLVKQVWACSLAHGVKLLPAAVLTEARDKTDALEKDIERLKTRLYFEQNKPPQVRIVRPPDWTEMLAAMLCATEPKPLPGIYFLISGGAVTYVGQSQNVLARMSGHTGKSFDTVRMIHQPNPSARLVEEGRWISAFMPRDNIAGKLAA